MFLLLHTTNVHEKEGNNKKKQKKTSTSLVFLCDRNDVATVVFFLYHDPR
jgi:hypothetical protein